MGVPPMSLTGILPVIYCFFCFLFFLFDVIRNNNGKDMGRMPMLLMGRMPMLLMGETPMLRETMQLKLWNMLLWVLPPSLAVWAVGAWPMYRCGGAVWLEAQTLAMAAGLVVMIARVAAIKIVVARAQARKERVNIAFVLSQAFMFAGMVTVLALLAVGVAMQKLLSLPSAPFFLWIVGFYMIMLAAETWWLSRVLKNLSPRAGNSADAGHG